MTLKFNSFRVVVKIHVPAKFHRARCRGSRVIAVAVKKLRYENNAARRYRADINKIIADFITKLVHVWWRNLMNIWKKLNFIPLILSICIPESRHATKEGHVFYSAFTNVFFIKARYWHLQIHHIAIMIYNDQATNNRFWWSRHSTFTVWCFQEQLSCRLGIIHCYVHGISFHIEIIHKSSPEVDKRFPRLQ